MRSYLFAAVLLLACSTLWRCAEKEVDVESIHGLWRAIGCNRTERFSVPCGSNGDAPADPFASSSSDEDTEPPSLPAKAALWA